MDHRKWAAAISINAKVPVTTQVRSPRGDFLQGNVDVFNERYVAAGVRRTSTIHPRMSRTNQGKIESTSVPAKLPMYASTLAAKPHADTTAGNLELPIYGQHCFFFESDRSSIYDSLNESHRSSRAPSIRATTYSKVSRIGLILLPDCVASCEDFRLRTHVVCSRHSSPPGGGHRDMLNSSFPTRHLIPVMPKLFFPAEGFEPRDYFVATPPR
jgi:hypothetical protein